MAVNGVGNGVGNDDIEVVEGFNENIPVEKKSEREDDVTSYTTHQRREEVPEGEAGFKPVLQDGEVIDAERAENAFEELDPESGEVLIRDGLTREELEARFRESLKNLPEEEQQRWLDLLMQLEIGLNSTGLSSDIAAEFDTMMSLMLALMLALVDASAEMKKMQRDLSFGSMKLQVEHLMQAAELVRTGAFQKFTTAMVSGGLTLAANAGAFGYISNVRASVVPPGGVRPELHTETMYMNMLTQAFGGGSSMIGSSGDLMHARRDAESREEGADAQKDQFNSDQFKQMGATTNETMSAALSNARDFISSYRSILDSASRNIV